VAAKKDTNRGSSALHSTQLLETYMLDGAPALLEYDVTAFYGDQVIESMAHVASHGCQVSRTVASSVLISIMRRFPVNKEDPREHVFRSNQDGILACVCLAGQPLDLNDANENEKFITARCRLGALMTMEKLTSVSDQCCEAVVFGGGIEVCAKLARLKGMEFTVRRYAAHVLLHLCRNDAHASRVDAADGIGVIVDVATDDQEDAEWCTARSMLRLLPRSRFERVLRALGGRVLSGIISLNNTTTTPGVRNTARSVMKDWDENAKK
jgi:hypothetical protein